MSGHSLGIVPIIDTQTNRHCTIDGKWCFRLSNCVIHIIKPWHASHCCQSQDTGCTLQLRQSTVFLGQRGSSLILLLFRRMVCGAKQIAWPCQWVSDWTI